MDEDALDAAREAVAATRLWREQMRHDWGIYREPEEVLDAAVGELLAERDRLRAVVDAALEVVRPMADSACDADVLRIADLYRILAGPALDESAEGAERTCPRCGVPYRLQRKWNSGNPRDFWMSDCSCEEPDQLDGSAIMGEPDAERETASDSSD